MLQRNTYTHWQPDKPSDTSRQCVVSQWYDTQVTGGSLYAYGATPSDVTNMSGIAGGWKEVPCGNKNVYFCRTASEPLAAATALQTCSKCLPAAWRWLQAVC